MDTLYAFLGICTEEAEHFIEIYKNKPSLEDLIKNFNDLDDEDISALKDLVNGEELFAYIENFRYVLERVSVNSNGVSEKE